MHATSYVMGILDVNFMLMTWVELFCPGFFLVISLLIID